MDKIMRKSLNKKLAVPFTVTLAGILVIVIAMFLPYLTAVGKTADFIDAFPDMIAVEALDLTFEDIENIPMISVRNLFIGVYSEDDGIITDVLVLAFCGFLALTAIFTLFRKPVAVMIFDLLTFGIFALLNLIMKQDIIDADAYAWGIGYYIIPAAIIAVFVGAIWMLIKKIAEKKKLKKPSPWGEGGLA